MVLLQLVPQVTLEQAAAAVRQVTSRLTILLVGLEEVDGTLVDALAASTCMSLAKRLIAKLMESSAPWPATARRLAKQLLDSQAVEGLFLSRDASLAASAVTDGVVQLLRLPGVALPTGYRDRMVAAVARTGHSMDIGARDFTVMLEFCPSLAGDTAKQLAEALLQLEPNDLASDGQPTPPGALVLGLLAAHEMDLVDPRFVARLLEVCAATLCAGFVRAAADILDRFAPPHQGDIVSDQDASRPVPEDGPAKPLFALGGDLCSSPGADDILLACFTACEADDIGRVAAALIRGSAAVSQRFTTLLCDPGNRDRCVQPHCLPAVEAWLCSLSHVVWVPNGCHRRASFATYARDIDRDTAAAVAQILLPVAIGEEATPQGMRAASLLLHMIPALIDAQVEAKLASLCSPSAADSRVGLMRVALAAVPLLAEGECPNCRCCGFAGMNQA